MCCKNKQFCTKISILSKILKLSFVKVTICKQIIRISVFDEPSLILYPYIPILRRNKDTISSIFLGRYPKYPCAP